MSDAETMTITLPRDLADDLRHAVEAGEFGSREEAVQSALRDWQGRRVEQDYSAEELRGLVEDGIASGPSGLASLDDVKLDARRRRRRAYAHAD